MRKHYDKKVCLHTSNLLFLVVGAFAPIAQVPNGRKRGKNAVKANV